MEPNCEMTLGSPYVVVIGVIYKVSLVLFSTSASVSKRLTVKSNAPGSMDLGTMSSKATLPQQPNGKEMKRSRNNIFLAREYLLTLLVSIPFDIDISLLAKVADVANLLGI